MARHCTGSVDWLSCIAERIRIWLTLVETVGYVVLRTSRGVGICCSDQLRKRLIEQNALGGDRLRSREQRLLHLTTSSDPCFGKARGT